LIGANACAPLDGFEILHRGQVMNESCSKIPELAYSILRKSKSIKVVIISSMGPFYFTGINYASKAKIQYNDISLISIDKNVDQLMQIDQFNIGYSNLIKNILLLNKKIYLVQDVPELSATCQLSRPYINKSGMDGCKENRSEVILRTKEYIKIFSDIKLRYPKINLIKTDDIFCDDSYCYFVKEGKLLYRDYHHINRNGSQLIWRFLMEN
jgi:hypothetical protein